MKAYPKGIYHLLPTPGGNFLDQFAGSPSLSKPWVAGFRARTYWRNIEPTEGNYDWSMIDTGLSIAKAAGKKLSLSIAAGINTPDWVYDSQSLCRRFPVDTGDLVYLDMPIPWDEPYLRKWEKFVQLFGQLYDKNPTLSAIFFTGFMQIAEMHVTSTDADGIAINAIAVGDGYANKTAAWVPAAEHIIDLFEGAFPDTVKLLTSSRPWGGPADRDQGDKDKKTIEDYGSFIYGDNFGLADSFLHATVDHTNVGKFVTYPRGAQAIHPSSNVDNFYADPQPTVFPMAPIPMYDLTQNGYEQGRQYVEVYATDMNNSTNDATLASQGEKLKTLVPAKGLHNRGKIVLGAASLPPPLLYAKGIYGSYGNESNIPAGLVANTGVVGIWIRQEWDVTETSDGFYDWSALDGKLAQARAAGFTNIAVDFVASSFDTPDWLIASLPADQKIQLMDVAAVHNDTFCRNIDTALFWNPTFHAKRLAFIAAAGARYQSNNDIIAVWASFANHNSGDWNIQDFVGTVACPGCGNPGTPDPGQLCGDQVLNQVDQWLDAGWTEEKMLQVGKDIADAVSTAWPRQNIKLPIGGLDDDLAMATPLNQGYSKMAVDIESYVYGDGGANPGRPYKDRFYMSRNVVDADWPLGSTYDPPYPPGIVPGLGAEAYLRYMIRRHARDFNRVAGLQMVAAATGSSNDCRLNGGGVCAGCIGGGSPPEVEACVMQAALDKAVSYNTTFVEVFAADAANTAFNSMFISATAALGGTPRS